MPKKTVSNPSKFDAIRKKIAPVAERPPFFSMLVYGESGRGKTAFASTFPKPILLLDIDEKGTDTIAKVPGIDVIHIEDWHELEQTYWFLKSKEHPYQTVVIDQITQMQDLAMAYVRGESSKTDEDLLSRR